MSCTCEDEISTSPIILLNCRYIMFFDFLYWHGLFLLIYQRYFPNLCLFFLILILETFFTILQAQVSFLLLTFDAFLCIPQTQVMLGKASPQSRRETPGESISAAQLVHSIGLHPSFLNEHPHQNTSIFHIDSKQDTYLNNNINNFEELCKATGEKFLCLANLHEVQKYSDWIMVLTDKGFYKFDVDSSLHVPRKRKALLDFHSVEADLSNPLLLTTRIYKASVKNNMKSSLFKFMGNLGSRIDSESFLQIRQYVCRSELQRDQLVWLMNRTIRNIWQSTLETHIIPSPEYYQTHQFVIKTNRKGSHQERLLVLSNQWLYNMQVSHAPTTIHSVKWAIRIDCIASVCLEAGNEAKFFFHQDKLALMIAKYRDDDRLGVNAKVVSDYEFTFRDDIVRVQFISALKFIFGKLTGKADDLLIVNNIDAIPPPPPPEDFDSPANNTTSSASTAANLTSGDGDDDSTFAIPTLKDVDDGRPLMLEVLEKLVKNSTKSHSKTFALYPNLTIKWGDSDKKFKYSAKVISVMPTVDIMENLPPEKKPCFFALRTSEKPLLLLAKSASDKATWLNVVQSLLSSTGSSAAGAALSVDGKPMTKVASLGLQSATSLSATVPLIKGPMIKYIKGGRDTHVKHFCLYTNGTIKWGNSDGSYKYSTQVLDIDQDITPLGGKISHEDAVRFIRIKTSEKTLELLCANQDSADRWMMMVNTILHPEQAYHIDLGLDEDE